MAVRSGLSPIWCVCFFCSRFSLLCHIRVGPWKGTLFVFGEAPLSFPASRVTPVHFFPSLLELKATSRVPPIRFVSLLPSPFPCSSGGDLNPPICMLCCFLAILCVDFFVDSLVFGSIRVRFCDYCCSRHLHPPSHTVIRVQWPPTRHPQPPSHTVAPASSSRERRPSCVRGCMPSRMFRRGCLGDGHLVCIAAATYYV